MTARFTESIVEEAALAWLEGLGYTILHGPEIAPGEPFAERVILEIYDAMQQAIETGQPYQTLLDPPPADPRVAHPPKKMEA